MPASPPPSAADRHLLDALERAFSHHAGPDARIDVAALQKALGLRSEYLARRVLAGFDKDRDGVIDRDEFIEGVRRLVFGSDRDKLEFAFRLHDHDGDGFLGEGELYRMIAISLAESDVVNRASQPPDRLARALLLMADTNRDGRISFEEFEAVVKKRPEVLRKMTRSEVLWISPSEDLLARFDAPGRTKTRVGRFLENRRLPLVFLVVWALVNLVLFASGLSGGSGGKPGLAKDPAMQIGRAATTCISFNGALILVPVMRRLLTWVRSTWLGRAVPVDDAVEFHRIVGHALVGFAALHSAGFIVSYALGHARSTVGELLFATSRGLTGLLVLVISLVMWVFALAFIRRSSRFELFYFTHLLYVAWFILAIAHAPSFGAAAGVPLLGFAVEQVLRLRRRAPESAVVATDALRSGVTRLEIQRPKGFTFGAADYAFLRIPAIARHEWHPFTISSAPERPSLTFHVRSLGNWTAALRRRVEDTRAPAGPLVAYVDGPYGSPSAHVFESPFVVLIGAGIGVTPFASILESIVLRANGEGAPSKLEKVHFFWLNRDQYSFEWFGALLSDLERVDKTGLVDFHLCMTGGRSGATALGLEMAREVMHAAGRSDIITGLRTMTHMGPPDWETMLKVIVAQHAPAAVHVYFCGPPGLGTKLRSLCARLGMPFREEQF